MRVEITDKFWVDKSRYDNAEKQHYESLNKGSKANNCSILASEIAKAREHIQNSLEKIDGLTLEPSSNSDILSRLTALETENRELKQQLSEFTKSYQAITKRLENELKALSEKVLGSKPAAAPATSAKTDETNDADGDDDVDLFGSESEDEDGEAARIRQERLDKYAAKKATKTAIIAKSSILLDVKPWDDEVDLKAMEAKIREITTDGLLWGASKFAPVAYGIQKLTISCVVEDEKVSIDWLTEEIEKNEDFVQSVDIAAFNKI